MPNSIFSFIGHPLYYYPVTRLFLNDVAQQCDTQVNQFIHIYNYLFSMAVHPQTEAPLTFAGSTCWRLPLMRECMSDECIVDLRKIMRWTKSVQHPLVLYGAYLVFLFMPSTFLSWLSSFSQGSQCLNTNNTAGRTLSQRMFSMGWEMGSYKDGAVERSPLILEHSWLPMDGLVSGKWFLEIGPW